MLRMLPPFKGADRMTAAERPEDKPAAITGVGIAIRTPFRHGNPSNSVYHSLARDSWRSGKNGGIALGKSVRIGRCPAALKITGGEEQMQLEDQNRHVNCITKMVLFFMFFCPKIIKPKLGFTSFSCWTMSREQALLGTLQGYH